MISETVILKRKSSPNEDFVCSENIISVLSDNFKVKAYQVWHVLKKSHDFVKFPPSMFFFFFSFGIKMNDLFRSGKLSQ